jgi:KAP family P-loop domain
VSITGRQFVRRLWGERLPIFGGLAFAAVVCSLSPLVWHVRVCAVRWISEPDQVNLGAFIALVAALGAVAVLVWPGPAAAKWTKSWWGGVVPGSFALPAVGAIFVFDIGFVLPFRIWLGVAILVGLSVSMAIGLSIRRSMGNEHNGDAADEPRKRLTEAWPERRELAKRIADCVIEDGKPTYAVYGEFGSGKSSMLNFIEECLRQDPGIAPIIVRFNGWLPGSQESLADQLLGDIAAECGKKYFVPQLRRISSKVPRGDPAGLNREPAQNSDADSGSSSRSGRRD